jgi:hypothetical protein
MLVSSEKYRRPTTVIRIPKEVFEEAEKYRQECLKKPKDGTDAFALIAAAGTGAFIGGLIGFAIATLMGGQKQTDSKSNNKEGVKV